MNRIINSVHFPLDTSSILLSIRTSLLELGSDTMPEYKEEGQWSKIKLSNQEIEEMEDRQGIKDIVGGAFSALNAGAILMSLRERVDLNEIKKVNRENGYRGVVVKYQKLLFFEVNKQILSPDEW